MNTSFNAQLEKIKSVSVSGVSMPGVSTWWMERERASRVQAAAGGRMI